MNNSQEDLFFQMAASAHFDDETRRIEAELDALSQEQLPPPSPQILEAALIALRAQQKEEQKSLRHKKTTRTIMRAAGFIVAFAIGGAVLITSVDALRVAVTNFFAETYEQFTAIQLRPEGLEENKGEVVIAWEDAYAPTSLPENYELASAQSLNDSIRILTYSNGISGESIRLDLCAPGVNATVNTEGVPIHNITIQGNDGFWFHQQQDTMVVWHNSEYVFVLSLPESIENFIEIAESVKKIE